MPAPTPEFLSSPSPTVSRYGHFDPAAGCFVLTADPPRKWRNIHHTMVADTECYAEVSNLGDGPIRIREKNGTTIHLVGYDHKFIYVRDDDTNTAFCPFGNPLPTAVTERVCRYWPAKTEISSCCADLRVTQRVFVPRHEIFEATTVTLDNRSARPRTVSVFFYAMFQLNGCDGEGRTVWEKNNIAHVHPDLHGVFVTNRTLNLPSPRFNGYMTTLQTMRAGNGYRDQFTRAEFSVGTPRLLWGANCDNQGWYGPDCAGIVQVTVSLPPRGTARVDYLLGNAADRAEAMALRARVTPQLLDQWSDEYMAIERTYAGKFQVDTGTAHTQRDALINLFVKKQMYSYLIDKSGFRDNLQADNGIALFDYPTARANVLRALASQQPDGNVLHSFRPLNRKQYADKPCWILQTVPWLIQESADFDLLDVPVPYFESTDRGTVWDHLQRTVRYLAQDTGKRGICRQHFADWNDDLEPSPETGERESVMVTQQFCFGLREVAELATRLGDAAFADECRATYTRFKDRLNAVAWDGRWYLRTICEDGYALGSGRNKEAKIFLNTQSWAILSGIADGERAKLCMQAVDELCTKDIGYVINDPPLTAFDPRIGRFSTTLPGHATNGGAYCHAAGFKAVADCLLGRADQAWETYLKTVPDSPTNPITRSRAEPFSFQNMYEAVPEIYGLAGYPWRTGTAAWFTMALVEWILGARRHYDGLLIDPCLTAAVPHATLTRTYRGATFHLTLDNTAGRCRGARSITLDGAPVQGNILPVTPGTHQVHVVI